MTIVRQFIHLKQKYILIFLAGVIIVCCFSTGAIANPSIGSLALSDLNNILLNQSPELRQQVTQALKAVKKDDVGCVAPLVRRPFSDLNNSRIAPFSCVFAHDKFLTIQAQNLIQLPDGETMPLEQFLKRENIPSGASLQFNLVSWQWSDTRQ